MTFNRVTLARLASIMPNVGPRAALYIDPLNAAMEEFHINNPARQRAFLAQVAQETKQLRRMTESFDYTPERMQAVFNNSKVTRFDAATAQRYGRTADHPADQVKIASIAYANRMGNGSAATGDGWKYRGRGFMHTTGKENYTATMLALDIDCVNRPELLEEPINACRAGAWFWKLHGLNELADAGDFRRVTKIINGGYNGLAERMAFHDAARKVIV